MISHSLSVAQLQFIFQQLLPQDLSDTTVLDVGSRLGAVLFGGYTLSNTKRLMGIEKQQHYCNIQRDIIATFKMEDRIEVSLRLKSYPRAAHYHSAHALL